MRYREWINANIPRRNSPQKSFYEWLIENTEYVENVEGLGRIRNMFDLNLYLEKNRQEFKDVVDAMPFRMRDMDLERLKDVLREDGFIFV
jgi:hypothetical protein